MLIITHHVYLTREQRYSLSKEKIEIVGVSSPIWIKNNQWSKDSSHEVFSRYIIQFTTEPERNTIQIMNDGYLITLTNPMPSHLLDIKDGGSMSLILTHRNVYTDILPPCPVVHFLQIEDISFLEKTIAIKDNHADLIQTLK
jgi:hypothetical protein